MSFPWQDMVLILCVDYLDIVFFNSLIFIIADLMSLGNIWAPSGTISVDIFFFLYTGYTFLFLCMSNIFLMKIRPFILQVTILEIIFSPPISRFVFIGVSYLLWLLLIQSVTYLDYIYKNSISCSVRLLIFFSD